MNIKIIKLSIVIIIVMITVISINITIYPSTYITILTERQNMKVFPSGQ